MEDLHFQIALITSEHVVGFGWITAYRT